jgi:hypothetical protein
VTVYERLQKMSAVLTVVRTQVDAVAGSAELRAYLQRQEAWLTQASRTVSEVRAWREHEARQFLPSVARRWVLVRLFALAAAWIVGAGYAYATKPYDLELRELRARSTFVEAIEDRVLTMTPADRRKFEELLRPDVAKR